MSLVNLMEVHPWIEVQVRKTAKYFSLIKKIYKKFIVKKKKSLGSQKKADKKILIDYLRCLGINKGDILIVHSSLRPLKCFGFSPEEIINILHEMVGENGTLVMPAFCTYDEKIGSSFDEVSNKEFVYDVQNSSAWTGVITDTFWRRQDVTRSEYPDNPLAACGRYSKEMFAEELKGDLAHGPYSAWRFCADHHAKVLFLGIPAFNSITEIHLPEDMLDEQWPINGWFKERHYEIRNNGHVYQKTTRIRKQFWSKYLTEYRCSYELRKEKLLMEDTVENVPVSFIPDLKKMEDFVTERALAGDLLIFRIPKKYYRKK